MHGESEEDFPDGKTTQPKKGVYYMVVSQCGSCGQGSCLRILLGFPEKQSKQQSSCSLSRYL